MNDDGVNKAVGLIRPPPDVQTIIDKTASFVAKNGPEFETKLLQGNEGGKFNFLKAEHPYHAYYKMKIDSCFNEVMEEESATNTTTAATPTPTPVPTTESDTISVIQKKASVIPVHKREKPQNDPFRYLYDLEIPATLTAQEFDIMKLVVQYSALNGAQFLAHISSRENKNPQFDFMKNTHRHFKFFMQLNEIYVRIVNPTLPLVNDPQQNILDLLKFIADPDKKPALLDMLYGKAEWETMKEEERRKKAAFEASERAAVNAIDWHDFVIVETIDFDEDEESESESEEEEEDVPMPQFFAQPTVVQPAVISVTEEPAEDVDMDTGDDDVDMDTGDDDIQPISTVNEVAPPEDADIEKRIRKGNVKRIEKTKVSTNDLSKYFKDPNTGELIPIDQASNHLRIKTLDPRWKEQKQREMEKFKTTNIAPDTEITDHILNMAKKLGVSDKETEVTAPKSGMIWDGYSSSAAFVQAHAQLNPKQVQEIQPNPRVPVYGPSIPTSNPPPPPMPVGRGIPPPPPSTFARTTNIPPPPPKNVGPRPPPSDESQAKKPKTE